MRSMRTTVAVHCVSGFNMRKIANSKHALSRGASGRRSEKSGSAGSGTKRAYYQELYAAFTNLRTTTDVEQLMKDLLTPHELKAVAERWQIVKSISEGVPHRKIAGEIGISIAKVTRGSKAMRKSHGGFKKFFS